MKSIRPGEPRPFSIAHRGASSTHPENTRASFDEALRAPIDGIEFDVQPSRDGVPVLYHDRTLRKLGGGGRLRLRGSLATGQPNMMPTPWHGRDVCEAACTTPSK